MAEKRETEQINMRLSRKLLRRLDKIGEPFDLTRTEMIRRAIEAYIETHDPQSQRPEIKVTPAGKRSH